MLLEIILALILGVVAGSITGKQPSRISRKSLNIVNSLQFQYKEHKHKNTKKYKIKMINPINNKQTNQPTLLLSEIKGDRIKSN